jgi:uncharacterized protein (DUF2062 family)
MRTSKPAWQQILQNSVTDRDPNSLAKGLALGLFVAFLPLPAFQAVIAFALAHLFNGNRYLAVAATLVTNWLTFAPVFLVSVFIGSALLPGIAVETFLPAQFSWSFLRDISDEALIAYVTGTLSIGTTLSLLGYLSMKGFAERREKSRWAKIEE